MIKIKIFVFMCCICVSTSGLTSLYYNRIVNENVSFYLDKKNIGTLFIESKTDKYQCKISNWKTEYIKGGGVIWLTTDRKAILFANTKHYLEYANVLACHGGELELIPLPVPSFMPGRVVDMNFQKKIYLALVLMDIKNPMYAALIAKFHSNENLISGNGFYNKNNSNNESGFYVDDIGYGGRISLNGEYFYPSELDCSVDAHPGLWSLINKKRVVFYKDDKDINVTDKCERLFSGVNNFTTLGGRFVSQ